MCPEPSPNPTTKDDPSLRQLCRQLLPLSFSDAAMAVADPLLAIFLTRLPNPTVQLAALGVVKSVAVFLESPIIMVLHASTALGRWGPSRRALNRFVWGLAGLLTLCLLALSLPALFDWLMLQVYDLPEEIAQAARFPLFLMVLWPAVIAWRRIHQGRLILQGRGKAMGAASLFRVGTFTLTLLLGSQLELQGAALGALALMTGLIVEALLAYLWAKQEKIEEEPIPGLPETVPKVAKYYTPLALTMLVMWGGRAALVALLGRSLDAELALAAWAAAWGFVILLANLTRMVQQLVIKYAGKIPSSRLFGLGWWAGLICSFGLALLGYSWPGQHLLGVLLGQQPELWEAAQGVVKVSVVLPLLVSLQNVLQGFCIALGKSLWINLAGIAGVALTLAVTWYGVSQGQPGASVAALGVVVGLLIEVLVLACLRPWSRLEEQV